MENCLVEELVELQAFLKAINKLNFMLLADVQSGKIAERRVMAERKQIVTVNGKKQIR
jgi:hypothetical protein